MKHSHTHIEGIVLIHTQEHHDDRGYFTEIFSQKQYHSILKNNELFVQDNFSHSHQGVLRGLHAQLPYSQGKLIHVLQGSIFDVAVDIRPSSQTFGQWFGIELSAEKNIQCWLPQGIAHGFVTLSETADILYKCTDYYNPHAELTLKWNDPSLNINWPITNPILSQKDQAGISWEQWVEHESKLNSFNK